MAGTKGFMTRHTSDQSSAQDEAQDKAASKQPVAAGKQRNDVRQRGRPSCTLDSVI